MYRKHIVGENPEQLLWWHLRHFKNVDRVIPLLRSRHNKESNAKKQAQEVSHCIAQSEEFFQAANSVTLATKPLLLYYGMASLAWALVLFKKTGDYALDHLRPKHQEHGLVRPRVNYGSRNLPLPEILDAICTRTPHLIPGMGSAPELP